MPGEQPVPKGKVYLVGAGPGDPGLITVRGLECLQQADVVMFDYLANAILTRNMRPEAEMICLGRHGRDQVWTQDDVNREMVSRAQAGSHLVRLKGGDPAIFGRFAEEVAALESAGIEFEIVPGVSTALAAGGYTGIPLTHRDAASAVAFVTARESLAKHEPDLDYHALARFPGTLVFYMGVTTADRWTRKLIQHGKAGDTPAVIVSRCTLPSQRTMFTTLEGVAGEIEKTSLRPPAIVIVGDVVSHRANRNWFADRPLSGRTVLLARPEEQAWEWESRLRLLGADVIVQPAIRISPVEDFSSLDRAIENLPSFECVVFSSTNGVSHLMERILSLGKDLRHLGSTRLAAIGPGTAERLAHYHLRADVIPDVYRAEGLAASLTPNASGKRFLLIRASRGRDLLADELRSVGANVEQVVAYRSEDVVALDSEIERRVSDAPLPWVIISSSAIARSLVRLFGANLENARLASISPVTSTTLRSLGWEPTVEANPHTMEGILQAILAAETQRVGP